MSRTQGTHWITLLVMQLLLAGCAARPTVYDEIVGNPAYTVGEKTVGEREAGFTHFVIEHLTQPQSGALHFYIEGDGTPWLDDHTVARDPTSRKLLALALMTQDTNDSIYVGRPCYFATKLRQPDHHCDYTYWTDARYSRAVIDSMASVVHAYIEQTQAHDNTYDIVLIGHSGGAVIATMVADKLAEQFNTPVKLVTLGGNLNVGAWAQWHHYTPLQTSLDPYLDFHPNPLIAHYHYSGGKDEVVPTAITASFTEKFHLPLTIEPAADHSCCWRELWPTILQRIQSAPSD